MNGKINERIVFDSNLVLNFLKYFKDTVNIQECFPLSDLFVSEITEIELLSFPAITDDEISNINRFLADVTIILLIPEIKKKTIEFRRASNCKLPDSVIAASAIVLDAALVTFDKELLKKQFPGFRTMRFK
jgi:predicted nucleic acid-binding protein